jgi:hypothetical protein
MRSQLNGTHIKSGKKLDMNQQIFEENTETKNASMIAQMGSLEKCEAFANEFLKRATLAIAELENVSEVEKMIDENPEAAQASGEVIIAGLNKMRKTLHLFNEAQKDKADKARTSLPVKISSGAMDEEGLKSSQDTGVPLQDLLKDLNIARKSTIYRASRISRAAQSASSKKNVLKSIRESEDSFEIHSSLINDSSFLDTPDFTADKENAYPEKNTSEEVFFKPKTEQGFRALQKFYKNRNEKHFVRDDYVESYRMTDNEDDDSDMEMGEVELKNDPNCDDKLMPFIGSKRVPLWAENKTSLHQKLKQQTISGEGNKIFKWERDDQPIDLKAIFGKGAKRKSSYKTFKKTNYKTDLYD